MLCTRILKTKLLVSLLLSDLRNCHLSFHLEPLQHLVITSPSFFCKHASIFINAVQDGFIAVGKDASGKFFLFTG